jgi:hypothetical protein
VGLGEPLFDKLDADIAYAMMGINAVKGVEIGAGFASVTQRGTTHGDSLSPQGFKQQRRRRAGRHQHRAGPGSEHRHQAHQFHPQPRESIDMNGQQPTEVVTKGRHDPCVGIRATPIAEAMLALVVMEHALRHRAQCADVKATLVSPIKASASDSGHEQRAPPAAGQLAPFAALSASYFAHIGFFNPYLPLWLKDWDWPVGHQRADLRAGRHAPVCALCLGLAERPHRRAREAAALGRRRRAACSLGCGSRLARCGWRGACC